MAISDFGYSVLKVVDDAEGYISTDEIAQSLSERGNRILPTGHVRPYLEHALSEYVERRPPDLWDISPSHQGQFSSSEKPPSKDETEQPSLRGNGNQEESHDELSRRILRVLADADTSLSVDAIANQVEGSGETSSTAVEFSKPQINRRLHYALGSKVEKDENRLWRLAGQKHEKDPGSNSPSHEEVDKVHETMDSDSSNESETKGDRSMEETESNQPTQQPVGEDGSSPAEVENQKFLSEDEGVTSETESKPEVSFSDIEEAILSVLDEVKGYAFIARINDVLNRDHGHDVERGQVRFYLQNVLSEYVVSKPSKGWRIASSYRGEFSFLSGPEPENESVSTRAPDDSEEDEDADRLSELVLQKLSEADHFLKASHIAEQIEDPLTEGTDEIEKEVNQRLREDLSSQVTTDDGKWWRLSKNTRNQSSAPRPEDSEADEEDEPEEADTVDESRSSESPADPPERVSDEDTPEEKTPAGMAAEVGEKLETAKQIAFLLDISRTPLSVGSLTSLLQARGRDVTEENIRQRLESTLVRFVAEEEGEGYYLREEFESPAENDAGSDSSTDETEQKNSGEGPVDAATRASISGRRYNYVFESQEMEDTSLFTSQLRGGTVKIKLNSSHAAFESLKHVLAGEAKPKTGSGQYRELIRLLIVAWTEVEGDLSGRRGELAEEIRNDWGRALRFLLQEGDEG
ncbi:hypothetical protein [Salinibacter ruber]|uniref:hypothetical protein n=1 Tax=Salinibacter ruber TaxID=146919 RepID=UPI0011AFB7E2|nr:hypothetical protein [Salinibacter ruber]MCS3675247.1 hypothetical protein [Salinibacter ruber]